MLSYIFMISALLGGTLFVGQFLLSLLGLGDHAGGDMDVHVDVAGHLDTHGGTHDSGSSWMFSLVSFRALVAALTVFGLSGLALHSMEVRPLGELAGAILCSLVTMAGVGALIHSMKKLDAEGTVKFANVVSQVGTVYLTIPAHKSGSGKVTVIVQNRTMEYRAMTEGSELPTGTRVVVTKIAGPGTVEVAQNL